MQAKKTLRSGNDRHYHLGAQTVTGSTQQAGFLLRHKFWMTTVSLLVLAVLCLVWRLLSNPLVTVPLPQAYPAAAEDLKSDFLSDGALTQASYESLFRYFIEGYIFYGSETGALVNYPGLPGRNGRRIDQMEGASRLLPLVAAWLSAGRDPVITLQSGKQIDLVNLVRRALLVGMNFNADEYWGSIKKRTDQRIVEAADIALTLWLTRDLIWKHFTPKQQKRMARWLQRANGKRVPDNNWHLFVSLVNAVLLELGREEGSEKELQKHYQAMKGFYRANGWFTDGVIHGEQFDYYNAWGIHYSLYWLDQIRPDLDRAFIHRVSGEFSQDFKFLFAAQGFPIYGRSTCYRMALPSPLIIAANHGAEGTTYGESRRAMDLIWRYFIQNGALIRGNVTQGYCGADPRILDDYSGQGSCLWSLRSLILALVQPREGPYWQAMPEPLPIERDNYSISLAVPGWRVIGNKQSGEVVLERINSYGKTTEKPLKDYGWYEQLKQRLTHVIKRPINNRAKYERQSYHSATPYCECLVN